MIAILGSSAPKHLCSVYYMGLHTSIFIPSVPFADFFRIEVTAQAVLQDESVIAEMIIEVPNVRFK